MSPVDDDYFAYQDRKTKPKPSHKRPMPKEYRKEEPMQVEESTASDTIIERIKAFWKK